jgi:hypothetical protein
MKVTLLYLRVFGKSDHLSPEPSYYQRYEDRFFQTYNKHKPAIDHDLIVVNCGTDSADDGKFDSISTGKMFYNGPGWDIGAYQNIVPKIESDIVLCMATPVHFWRDRWLEPILLSSKLHGHGVYAPMASYETSPHLRTGCFAVHPKLMADYPEKIDNRDKCCTFESRPGNFSQWAIKGGFPVFMVTESGDFGMSDWRKPDNIFRRGDQSNCLTWDRHNDIYFEASVSGKSRLANSANG